MAERVRNHSMRVKSSAFRRSLSLLAAESLPPEKFLPGSAELFGRVFRPAEIKFILASEGDCRLFDATGPQKTNPSYSGFSRHQKLIQNSQMLSGEAYRIVKSLNSFFSVPGAVIGIPFSLLSSGKLWALVHCPDPQAITPAFTERLKKLAGHVVDKLEKADNARLKETAARYLAQEEAVAVLVHQLKTPLNSFARILENEGKFYSSSAGFIGELSNQLKMTQAMISSYLDYMKIRAFKPVRVNLMAVVEEIRKYFEFSLKEEGINFRIFPVRPLLEYTASGSPVLIFQALQNLVENAAKAVTAGGEISITISRSDPDQGVPVLLIDVCDSGPGVAGHIEVRMFEPFITGFPGGHGMGLGICRKIAGLHGGSIHYHRPAPGRFGGFLMKLPAAGL